MKKIGTITFHSSYNYGSCLQAYALQEFVKALSNNINYKIINYRSNVQKELYKTCYEKKGLKNYLKRIFFLRHKKEIQLANSLYEDFINNYLNITEEYNNEKDLIKLNGKFNYLISGSDQIWNIRTKDFSKCYFLNFDKETKKIAYSASFGPKKISFDNKELKEYSELINNYDGISVRELGSADNIKKITGKNCDILVDPTMLLSKKQWLEIIDDKPLIKGDYIFLYNLKNNKDIYKIADEISKKLKMPIIVPRFGYAREITKKYKRYYATGPREFLNLLYNSKLVLSSSFHGNVFSIIFNKPFFALNGKNDFRINTMLEKFKLSDRSIALDELDKKLKNVYNVKFNKINAIFEKERKKSKAYLEKMLDLK